MAHYNAPRMYRELEGANRERFNVVTMLGFSCAAVLYALLGCFGFLTFGTASKGLILNNYAATDKLATLARLATGVGVVCGYPLGFQALRDCVAKLMGIDNSKRENVVTLTIALLVFVTGCALRLTDVGKVVGVGGALVGTLLVFVLPALMNLFDRQHGMDTWTAPATALTSSDDNNNSNSNSNRKIGWLLVDTGMLVVGSCIAALALAPFATQFLQFVQGGNN